MDYIFEFILVTLVILYVLAYRKSSGEKVGKFIINTVSDAYNSYAPYSYKEVRTKIKALNQDFTPRQYLLQVVLISGMAAVIAYLYFYNIIIAIIYSFVAFLFVPYLTYLRSKRLFSEFIFEQIQIYTTNVIMEFNTTQSFVKALEGVRDSGVLEDPVLTDVKIMINMAYENGTIDEAIEYMNSKYDFYIVRNMHQLFLQITKEGSKNSSDALEGMLQDIDMLVENVYRDRLDRKSFHGTFLTFGIMLYFLIVLIQFVLKTDSYMLLLQNPLVNILLHGVLIINTYFLLNGEKYYNENVGAE